MMITPLRAWSQQPAAPPVTAQQDQPGQPAQPLPPHSQVLFSRSTASPGAAQAQPPDETAPAALAASVTDAMRAAPLFTAYDFVIHLQPATAALQVELRATVRNGGPTPLAVLPLQLGSSLHFEHVRAGGAALRFAAHTIASDADHTGALTEAAVALPSSLAPGASATITIDYAGTIAQSSERLDRIGTPAELAMRSDWDRIGDGFTGLRGFGNSVWYPVASLPAVLGDGARLFGEIGRQQAVNGAATVSMAITVEFTGDAPNAAVLDGHTVALGAPASMPSASFPGVLRVQLSPTVLGFAVPSLVLVARAPSAATPLVAVTALPAHADAASSYGEAAGMLTPLFQGWLGAAPKQPLELVDLPLEGDQPAQDGDALLLSLRGGSASRLAAELSGPLAHAYFHSPRAWLSEGVAQLMAVLWTERTEGRERALQQLGAGRDALALAEPASPGVSAGQPLARAQDAVFYRTKAAYVLWMLRGLVGDEALGAALRAYDPARDTTPGYFESLVERATAAAPPVAGQSPSDQPAALASAAEAGSRNLRWFFANWVDADLGLPDLSIANVFPSRSGAGDQWLVAVTIRNAGYAEAAVPVTVRSAGASTTVRVRVPARGEVTRRLLILGEPTEADVNDGSVPEVGASTHQRLLR